MVVLRTGEELFKALDGFAEVEVQILESRDLCVARFVL
jgi:hypothetical protein